MRKYYFMTKTEYIKIYQRQKLSGLKVDDFCSNENYSKSSFYHWKRKFLNDTEISELKTKTLLINEKQRSIGIVPINIRKENAIAKITEPQFSARTTDQEKSEISIELPNGFKIKVKGENNAKSAIEILTKICSANVQFK